MITDDAKAALRHPEGGATRAPRDRTLNNTGGACHLIQPVLDRLCAGTLSAARGGANMVCGSLAVRDA